MQRLLASILLCLLPMMAAAQAWAPPIEVTPPRLPVSTAADHRDQGEWVLPVWRTADGRWMALAVTGSSLPAAPLQQDMESGITAVPLTATGLELVDASSVLSTGLQWSIAPNVFARAGVNQRVEIVGSDCHATPVGWNDCHRTPLWLGGEFGGGYQSGGFRLDLGVSWLDHANAAAAPSVLPSNAFAGPGLLGVPPEFVESLGGVKARGSVRLGDSDTSVSVGASMGRLSLFPGAGLGLQAIDQKALSLGIGTGPINGLIVGRVMEPMQELQNPLSASGRTWSAIDLGISLRLPWEGEISVGAQNVWSSGAAPLPNAATDPAQRRVPYIQYHQEL